MERASEATHGRTTEGEGREERGKTKCEEGIRKVGNGELELVKNRLMLISPR